MSFREAESLLTMTAPSPASSTARARIVGIVLSTFAALFLLFDVAIKLIAHPEAVRGTTELGYPASSLLSLGVIEGLCLLLYLVPRTATLGAVLFTGYLGGAIATHVRIESPLFSHIFFPLYVAALLWGGLALRDGRVRSLYGPRTLSASP
jgi:hypothetical protein